MGKELEIKKLNTIMLADKRLNFFNTNLVLGEGSLDSFLFFIGEAPGKREDELMIPFVGRSGKLLNKSLDSIKLKREDVYITNLVKRRPPLNRNPKEEEVKHFAPYLLREIEIIKPKIIVSLGKFSFNFFFPDKMISQCQGKLMKYKGYNIFPIYHPAATFRSKKIKEDYYTSFQILKKLIQKYGQ
jgi:uracil-DNA glycosylase